MCTTVSETVATRLYNSYIIAWEQQSYFKLDFLKMQATKVKITVMHIGMHANLVIVMILSVNRP